MSRPLQILANSYMNILRKVYFSIIYPHRHYVIVTRGKVPATYVTHLKVLHNLRYAVFVCL